MVRFCNNCKRAVDDTDKFCRTCGHGTDGSMDYHTYYNLFEKSDNGQRSLYWFNIGKDIAIREELANIRKKVDIMYEKLFPSPVKELMEINEKVIEIDNKDEKAPVTEHQDIKDDEIVAPEYQGTKGEDTEDNKNHNVLNDDNGWAWKDESVPDTQEVKVETQDVKVDNPDTQDVKVDNPDTQDVKVDNPDTQDVKVETQEVHEEADTKLGALLGPEDKGQRDALKYLIHKYSKKDNNSGEGSTDKVEKIKDKNVITIIPKEDITRENARRKGESRGMYHNAIFKFIPDILKEIGYSNDGRIRVKISDIAEKMGEQFVGKNNVTIYTGLKYSLFDHNIVVEMGTLKEIDPLTQKNVKVLIMRMKNPDDKLPPSKLRRKGKFVEINID